jgi:Polyketide cyclase / dehydrase and lipid transport
MTTVPGRPEDVLELLTDPAAIARWAPVPFELLALEGGRLRSGDRARVAGRLAGRSVQFNVRVLRASDERFELVADGPVSLGVLYVLRPTARGSQIDASVSVAGQGLFGHLLARATEALLGAGALRLALERLAGELEPALAA